MHSDQLKYLIELSHSNSFLTAAGKLHITHTGLRYSINALEKELGVQLVSRTNKGSHLTQKGEELVELALSFFSGVERIIQDIPHTQKEVVKLATKVLWYEDVFSDILLKSHQEYPEVKYSCKILDSHDEIIDYIQHNSDYIALINLDEQWLSAIKQYEKIEYKVLFETETFLICSKQHPLAKRKQVYLNDINDTLICSRSKEYFEGPGINHLFKTVFYETNPIAFQKMILKGNAVSLGGIMPCSPYYFPYIENTVRLPIVDYNRKQSFVLLWNKEFKLTNSATIRFVNEFVKIINNTNTEINF